jgi:putative glutamine amidotransferase
MRGVPRFALSEFYVKAILAAGGLPLLLPNVEPDLAASYLSRVDALLLSGGLDVDPLYYDEGPHQKLGDLDQVRDEYELALAKGARDSGMPVLAICRGVQVLNVAYGGTLIQDIPSEVDGALKHEQHSVRQDSLSHRVRIEPGTKLHEIAGGNDEMRVNSFHHQSVKDVANGFVITARTSDGVIEAIEDPRHPFCVGVQWHPERTLENDLTRALFAQFVAAARTVSKAGI